jgi:DNA-binding transcriptional LysR family regulator
MELRHLRYFLAVAEHLNFSEASRRLHVAQPAISQTILDLEAELEVKLLLRTRRSVQLTAAGNSFKTEAHEIIRRSVAAKTSAQRAARGEVGSLSIGFLPSGSGPILPGLVEAYRTHFPDVTINLFEMTPAQQLKAFDEKRIDIGFSRPIPKERAKEFRQELIYNDSLKLALPEQHPLARKKLVSLKDLRAEKFIQFHRAGSPIMFDSAVAVCRRVGFSPNVIREPEQMATVMLFVESGLGVSLVPGSVRNLNHPKSVLRATSPTSAKMPLCAAWPVTLNSPVLDSFVEVLLKLKPAIQKKME